MAPSTPQASSTPPASRPLHAPDAGEVDERAWLSDLALGLLTLLVYLRCVTQGLVPSWDDGRFIVDNADVQHVSWGAFVRLTTEPHFQAWHPLHLLSYWIDVPLFGPSGGVQHGVNLALLLAALLVLRRVFVRLGFSPLAAVVGALFVGLHPAQVEAVAWATGRKEVLVLLFASLMFAAHLRSARPWDKQAWLSRLFFLLAALSKTTSLPLPLALLALDLLLRRSDPRTALLRQLPSLLLALGLGLITVFIWREHEMIRQDPTGLSLPLMTLTHDLRLLFAPTPDAFSPVHALRRDAHFAATDIIGIAVWLGLGAIAWRLKSKRGLFALVCFALLAAPTLNFVPTYFQRQDRYLSLPLLAVGFGVATLTDGMRATLGHRASAALMALALLGLAGTNVIYQGAWRSDDALWAHATRVEPRAFYAWLKLCELKRDQGEFPEAVAACEQAVAVRPELRIGLSALFLTQAKRDEAEHDLPPNAMRYGARFHSAADNTEALRELGAELLAAGYQHATLVALGRSLDRETVSDERLEHAARVQLAGGRGWLARYYLSRMTRPPILRNLRAFLELGEHPTLPPGGATSPPHTIDAGTPAPASPNETAAPQETAQAPASESPLAPGESAQQPR